VVTVDITCDMMDEDESGYVWTFLRDARDPDRIKAGAISVAGEEDAPSVAQVVEIGDKPAGKVVHLRLLASRSRTTVGSQGSPKLDQTPSPPV
jgi:hypothetical protein